MAQIANARAILRRRSVLIVSVAAAIIGSEVLAAPIVPPFDSQPFEQIAGASFSAAASSASAAGDRFILAGLEAIESNKLIPQAARPVSQLIPVVSDVADLLSNMKTVYDVSEAETLSDIARALSTYNTSATGQRLTKVSSDLRQASREYDVSAPPAPPIAVYVAAAASNDARAKIQTAANEGSKTLAELNTLNSELTTQLAEVTNLEKSALKASSRAENRAFDLSNFIENLNAGNPLEAPFVIAATATIEQLITASSHFKDLANQASDVASELHAFQSRVQSDQIAFTDVVDIYSTALSTPLAQSFYEITGNFVGYGQSLTANGAEIAFVGTMFFRPGIDLDPQFGVGQLTFFNGSGSEERLDDFLLELTLHRSTLIHGIGSWDAEATTYLHLSYLTTAFDPNPYISADRITVHELGINAAVFEWAYASFDLLGGVNSPFKIYGMRVTPGFEHVAFIERTSVSLPGTVPLITAFGVWLAAGRKGRGRSER